MFVNSNVLTISKTTCFELGLLMCLLTKDKIDYIKIITRLQEGIFYLSMKVYDANIWSRDIHQI